LASGFNSLLTYALPTVATQMYAGKRGEDMEITLTIPDSVAEQLQDGSNGQVARRLLELAALEGYRSGQLTSPQIQEMLGLDRFALDGFLKAHGVLFDYPPEQLEREVATIRKLQVARHAA
jgi:hypothetical protein